MLSDVRCTLVSVCKVWVSSVVPAPKKALTGQFDNGSSRSGSTFPRQLEPSLHSCTITSAASEQFDRLTVQRHPGIWSGLRGWFSTGAEGLLAEQPRIAPSQPYVYGSFPRKTPKPGTRPGRSEGTILTNHTHENGPIVPQNVDYR